MTINMTTSPKALLALACMTAASLTTTAHAQPLTDSFTYQGQLGDGGTPATGLYDITFVVYTAPVGGTAIASVTQEVSVTDGLFEAFVDFGTMGTAFDSDQTRYLELRVSEAGQPGFTTLEPRQRFAPAPVANYALRAGFAQQTNTSLQEAFDNGSTIFREAGDPIVDIQSNPALASRLNLGNGFGGSGPGQFAMYTRTGGLMFTVEQDTNPGGGGFLQIARNDTGAAGLFIDGNTLGSESPRLELFGQLRFMSLNTNNSGDDSVRLPANAISSVEIFNEPGLAESETFSVTSLTDLNGTIDIVNTVTINCPAPGFVFVIASAELSINHVTGTSSSVNVAVSDVSSTIPTNGDLETRIDADIPTGLYDHAVTTHAVFSVNAGIANFFLLGDKNNTTGSASLGDRQLTAIFIPTVYGSASIQATQPGTTLPDELSPTSLPMTSQDILMEQNAAIIANNQRLEREMEAMKAQMQEVLEQNQRILSQQSKD